MAERVHTHTDHIDSAADLVTMQEETRAWFVTLALERNRQSTPMVEEARALQDAARAVTVPEDLLNMPGIATGVLIAAGITEKAISRLNDADRVEAITALIRNHLEPAGDRFIDELVFRFLLTRGEVLGESMRNMSGILAQRKVIRAVISALNMAGLPYRWRARAASWIDMSDDDSEIERTLQGLTWTSASGPRTMLFNLNVPVVGGIVDMVLFGATPQLVVQSGYAEYDMFLLLGEIKGGVDPAAGENVIGLPSALNRFRVAFEETHHLPMLLFLGAAIEEHTALALWQDLLAGRITNAANLSRHAHLNAVARWLVAL